MAGMRFDLSFGEHPLPRASRGEVPLFRILVLGDFSGGVAGETSAGLAGRRPIAIDVDAFEQAMARLAPCLPLAADGDAASFLEIRSLDDFHPDGLYRRLELFAPMRSLRERLLDPNRFADAAAELKRAAGPVSEAAATQPPTTDDAALLDRLFGPRPGRGGERGPLAAAELDARSAFVEAIVGRYVQAAIEQEQTLLIAAVDDALSRAMRAVLHRQAFRAVESAWRGLHFLVIRAETGEDLQIFALDARREDMAAEVARTDDDLSASRAWRLLVNGDGSGTAGGGWSLIAADFRFGPAAEDLRLLDALGRIAAAAGGAFVAEAQPALLGCRSEAELAEPRDWPLLDAEAEHRWRTLRRSSAASSIALVLPRLLIRRPYGVRSDPIESFAFDEMAGTTPAAEDGHERLLWTNPAFACATLIAAARGEGATATGPLQLEDLPAYTYVDADGEKALTPCAEVFLSDRAADAILARGLVPLLSHRHAASIRLPRLHSVADPPARLAVSR